VGDDKITPHDADELAGCFAAHAREVFGHACALARGDRARADDLVQAAFEAAAAAWPGLRDLTEEQRRSWLRRTVANIAVSGLRREAAFRDRLARIEVRHRKTPADPSGPPFSPVTLERCWQIIRELPERQHAIALMRWQLDMKEAEIAAAAGLAEKTVSATMDRVRHKLTAQLGPDHPLNDGNQENDGHQEGASP
jgi:RNA polymerase sigma factor (sigma-70 family)